MCLDLSATPTNPNLVGATRLSRISGLVVTKERGAFHFTFGGRGCSCPLLAQGYDLAGNPWQLDPERIPMLETALVALAEGAGGFQLTALWEGDVAITESVLSLPAFVQLLRESGLRRGYRYHVEPT